MEFSRYLRLITKKLWIIVLLEVVTLASTFYYTKSQPLLYTAKATIILNPSVPNALVPYFDANSNLVTSLADNYNLILKSDKFLQKVADQSDIPLWELRGDFNSKLAPGTLFFYISSTLTDPLKAQKVASTVTRIFISDEINSAQNLPKTSDAATTTADLKEELKSIKFEITGLREQIKQIQTETPTSTTPDRLKSLRQDLVSVIDIQSRLILAISDIESKNSNDTKHNSALLVDDAKVPTIAEPINTTRNVIFAFIIALALGIGFVVLLDYLDYTVRSTEELSRLTGFTNLGVIPLFKPGKIQEPKYAADSSGPLSKEVEIYRGEVTAAADSEEESPAESLNLNGLSPYLVTATEFRSAASEAYRVLRTNILFSNLTGGPSGPNSKVNDLNPTENEEAPPIKSFLVTSAFPKEGKSLTAANLAVAFAQAGNLVILVDADMRQPSQHIIFGLKNEIGFSNLILNGFGQLSASLNTTAVPNLVVVTAGKLPPNPSELLTSPKGARIIEALKDTADILIIDSPPTNLVTDAAILSNRVDRVLVVVKWGKTRRNAIQRTFSSLKKVGANISGTVLNRARSEDSGSYYGGYGYGYGYGYGNNSSERNENPIRKRRSRHRVY